MKTQRYVLSRLSPDARAALVEELVQWVPTVWNFRPDDDVGTYWLDRKAYSTIVYAFRTDDGELAGFTTIKFYRVEHDGKQIVGVKLGLGVDAKHRGYKFALRCLMWELLRVKLRHPLVPLYLFSALIHPVSYKLCCDLLSDRLYPYFKNPDNATMQRLAERLAERFNLPRAESPHPFVYRDRFWSVETPQASEYWRASRRPEVRWYVEHCPTYHCSQDCLIGLAPLQLTHVLPLMLLTLVRNHLDRWRGRKTKFA
jgi:hypothetical protein